MSNDLREARMSVGLSQRRIGELLGWSADKVWELENDRLPSLTIADACEAAALLGFDFSARLYPNGARIRDAGQAPRLMRLDESQGVIKALEDIGRGDVGTRVLDDDGETAKNEGFLLHRSSLLHSEAGALSRAPTSFPVSHPTPPCAPG